MQINDEENMLIITEREPKLSDLEKLVSKLDEIGKREFLRLETEVIPLNYANASSLTDIARQRLSPDGTVQFNDDLNVLIVTDVRSKINNFKDIIKKLDIAPKQILVEVKIIETKSSGEQDIGFDWSEILEGSEWSEKYNKMRSITDQFQRSIHETPSGRSEQTTKMHSDVLSKNKDRSIILATSLSNTLLNFLVEKTKAKVLTTSSIVTLNNKKGEIFLRSQYDYHQSPNIQLQVTPRIGADNSIILEIKAGIGTFTLTGEGYYLRPLSSAQEVTSTVILKDNQTFILGGLKIRSIEKTKKKFPILGDIFGFLFSKTIEKDIMQEILIFVTPKIKETAEITDIQQLDKLEKEFKK